ncbi:hypothetical protein NEDG_02223 [Nematocida displodere]|uniref:Methyltransferase FkbM domain-containing protein n=1 Tax=Nematocida displodere TaxID=1805483 RepID=A0A177EKU3_9MICR|nr:hypothetical protein NEDG_02223 [Nematocida displodere]
MAGKGTLWILFAAALIGLAEVTARARKEIVLGGKVYNIYRIPRLGRFYIDKGTDDSTKKQLAQKIYWEENIGDNLARNARPGSIAVDAGSHMGLHTVRLSKAVGESGQVYSFEPQIKMHREQQGNLKLNKINNVKLFRRALGAESKMVEMCPYNPTNEGGQLVGTGGDKVQMIKLDDLNLENVSVIKADVEYYEYLLFKGAEQTIKRCQPVIIFELIPGGSPYDFCPEEMRTTWFKSKELLESWGYTVELIYGADYIAFPPHMKDSHPQVSR